MVIPHRDRFEDIPWLVPLLWDGTKTEMSGYQSRLQPFLLATQQPLPHRHPQGQVSYLATATKKAAAAAAEPADHRSRGMQLPEAAAGSYVSKLHRRDEDDEARLAALRKATALRSRRWEMKEEERRLAEQARRDAILLQRKKERNVPVPIPSVPEPRKAAARSGPFIVRPSASGSNGVGLLPLLAAVTSAIATTTAAGTVLRPRESAVALPVLSGMVADPQPIRRASARSGEHNYEFSHEHIMRQVERQRSKEMNLASSFSLLDSLDLAASSGHHPDSNINVALDTMSNTGNRRGTVPLEADAGASAADAPVRRRENARISRELRAGIQQSLRESVHLFLTLEQHVRDADTMGVPLLLPKGSAIAVGDRVGDEEADKSESNRSDEIGRHDDDDVDAHDIWSELEPDPSAEVAAVEKSPPRLSDQTHALPHPAPPVPMPMPMQQQQHQARKARNPLVRFAPAANAIGASASSSARAANPGRKQQSRRDWMTKSIQKMEAEEMLLLQSLHRLDMNYEQLVLLRQKKQSPSVSQRGAMAEVKAATNDHEQEQRQQQRQQYQEEQGEAMDANPWKPSNATVVAAATAVAEEPQASANLGEREDVAILSEAGFPGRTFTGPILRRPKVVPGQLAAIRRIRTGGRPAVPTNSIAMASASMGSCAATDGTHAGASVAATAPAAATRSPPRVTSRQPARADQRMRFHVPEKEEDAGFQEAIMPELKSSRSPKWNATTGHASGGADGADGALPDGKGAIDFMVDPLPSAAVGNVGTGGDGHGWTEMLDDDSSRPAAADADPRVAAPAGFDYVGPDRTVRVRKSLLAFYLGDL